MSKLQPGARYNWQIGARNTAITYWRTSGFSAFTLAS